MKAVFSYKNISEWFEPSNWNALELDPKNIISDLRRLIPWNNILTARFASQYDNKDRLDRVHLLFFTEKILFYVYLGHGAFLCREYKAADLSVHINLLYSSATKLKTIRLLFDIAENGNWKTHYLDLTGSRESYAHAKSLIDIFRKFKEGELHHE